jgi:hypothetical protein
MGAAIEDSEEAMQGPAKTGLSESIGTQTSEIIPAYDRKLSETDKSTELVEGIDKCAKENSHLRTLSPAIYLQCHDMCMFFNKLVIRLK